MSILHLIPSFTSARLGKEGITHSVVDWRTDLKPDDETCTEREIVETGHANGLVVYFFPHQRKCGQTISFQLFSQRRYEETE
jgi:hypothetical protein